ncbi:MAG: hypothetical protein AB7I35_01450 [Ramlibacter sp.]
MIRSIDQWRSCDPAMMAREQSVAAIQFAFEDAKRDILALAASADALRVAFEKLQPLAQRYIWLREQDWNSAELCVVTDPKRTVRLGTDCPSRARLDDAIDARIAAQRAQQGGAA